jgi:hypothetical protein
LDLDMSTDMDMDMDMGLDQTYWMDIYKNVERWWYQLFKKKCWALKGLWFKSEKWAFFC